MKNIVLVCAAGMSTSMLVEKMKEAASKKGIEVAIQAFSESKLKDYDEAMDVLLLGPQVGFLEEELKAIYEPATPVRVIDSIDYGMMNGEKVLEHALNQMENQ